MIKVVALKVVLCRSAKNNFECTSFKNGIRACFRVPTEKLKDDKDEHDAQKRKGSCFLVQVQQ
jgi:hypothetical protein